VHTDDLLTSWRRAQLAVVAWARPGRAPGIEVVVPLVRRDVPVLALHYGRLGLADALAAAGEAVVAVGGVGGVGGLPAPSPVAARVDVAVAADPEGERFVEEGLLDQELAKHPPSRRRIDSPLQRREHWWYVPRLLVRLHRPRELVALRPADALVACGDRDVTVTTCHLGAREPVEVTAAGADPLPAGPATVLEHGADLPDLEMPWERRWEGRLTAGRLETDRVDVDAGPRERPLGLLARIQVERRLGQACRAGLRDAGVR
jgi:hypothetical protein